MLIQVIKLSDEPEALEAFMLQNQTQPEHAFVYVGRNAPYTHPLRNRAKVKEIGRDAALAFYKEWLNTHLKIKGCEERKAFDALLRLAQTRQSLTLACHCVPLGCHACILQETLLLHLAEAFNPVQESTRHSQSPQTSQPNTSDTLFSTTPALQSFSP